MLGYGRVVSPGFVSGYRQWFRQQAPDLNPDATGIGWEVNGLASNPAHAATLRLWRRRMIEHLGEQGAPFLANGALAPRPLGPLHSPSYPRKPEKS